MESKTIGFIGGGRITRVFLQAIENSKIIFKSVVVCDTDIDVLNKLKKQYPRIQIGDCVDIMSKQDIIFIALHPPHIMDGINGMELLVSKNTQVISLAPKITFERLKQKLPACKIARMIPNATSFINEGFNPISFSKDFTKMDKKSFEELFTFLGNNFEVEESKLEAYAIISAMLPTYFWFQMNEIQKVGQQIGLNETESKRAIKKTLIAAIHLMYDSDISYEQLIDLIPIKPLAENEIMIRKIISNKLIPLYDKIQP